MKQGDIYWADLNPNKGSEQKGVRPFVIISGNSMNENFPVIIGCPITSHVKNYPGCIVLKKNEINNLEVDSEVLGFQIRTVSKIRLKEKIGEISLLEIKEIIKNLNEILIY